ncbi:hypothetical protein IscW_ISCW004664 [Ixodes scapularis]|uniref:Uncharacterized protein n=1 Tax=Ixodes scapularis TaxID=6945 RepID=B7PK24_IXOSC|nr:hypothetical protein IscW_ISCW004664 [Ixodes scapularis]|eukprot:XP_002409150.1 hypothetical protein IscW_ISCW004664 [Ixodes scapularis]
MAARGIKVEDVKVQYADRRHPGAKITVTSVHGQFNGYHPEVFVGWNHLMSTKSEYIVQARIVTLTTGELFTKIYVSDPSSTTGIMVPVRVKLGTAQFLTTTALKKGSCMGSGVSVKAEKLVIDDVQVLDHPREVVRKLGLQLLNSLVQKVVNSHTLEKSLASAVRKEWKSTYVPLPRDRLPTYSYEE